MEVLLADSLSAAVATVADAAAVAGDAGVIAVTLIGEYLRYLLSVFSFCLFKP